MILAAKPDIHLSVETFLADLFLNDTRVLLDSNGRILEQYFQFGKQPQIRKSRVWKAHCLVNVLLGQEIQEQIRRMGRDVIMMQLLLARHRQVLILEPKCIMMTPENVLIILLNTPRKTTHSRQKHFDLFLNCVSFFSPWDIGYNDPCFLHDTHILNTHHQ